jgi:hypothetical protein
VDDAIDEFHRHELIDRLHCVRSMFHVLICDHPAATLIQPELDAIDSALSEAYQKAGRIDFDIERGIA